MKPLVRFFEVLGRRWVAVFEEIGRFFYILHSTFLWTFRRPFDAREWAGKWCGWGWIRCRWWV